MDSLPFPFGQTAGFITAAILALAVLRDANGLRERGVRLMPVLWAILVFCTGGLALVLYLVLRVWAWGGLVNPPSRPLAALAEEPFLFSIECECGRRIPLTE